MKSGIYCIKNEYGFRLPEDFKYDFTEEINKRWKEI